VKSFTLQQTRHDSLQTSWLATYSPNAASG